MTTRTPLRRDLADLKQKVYMLGEKCIEIADLYNSLLENYSPKLEERFIEITKNIKNESKELYDQCFLVLTLQQPLIKDLRFVIGSLQIVLNLDKTTDLYNSTLSLISDINILDKPVKDQLINMAKKVEDLIRHALTLYLSSNITIIEESNKLLQEINFLHDIVYKQILKEVAQESGEKAQIEAQILSTIRTLEKISDLITGTIEQVNYIIVGRNL